MSDSFKPLTVAEILQECQKQGYYVRYHSRRSRTLLVADISTAPESVRNAIHQSAVQKIATSRTSNQTGKRKYTGEEPPVRHVRHKTADDVEPEEAEVIPPLLPITQTRLFMALPSTVEVEDCLRSFIKASSNTALKHVVCGACAREKPINETEFIPIADIPSRNQLVPEHPHIAHVLTDGVLLETIGVKNKDSVLHAHFCSDCMRDLKRNQLPTFALANRMWIGVVPDVLACLTIPEQLLISPLYTRCFVFKLHPKGWCDDDVSSMQRGMRGNVTSFPMNMDDIIDMVHGDKMPRPTSILPSIIAVTFIGRGRLPSAWLKSTFRVRRHAVLSALEWLAENNRYFRSYTIDHEILNSLPEDDVPIEILAATRQETDTAIIDLESASYVPTG